MNDELDIRCDPRDVDALHEEIRRRDKIINALIHRIKNDLNNAASDFSLLQTTFVLEEEVSRRTRELESALEALTAAKAEAEASRQLLVHAINTIPDGILLWNPEDKLVLCNEASLKLWGMTNDTTIGRSFVDLVSHISQMVRPGDSTAWFEHALREHNLANGTNEERLDNGTIMQIRERKTPEGFTVGIHTDITKIVQLKSAEAARQQLLSVIDFLPDATFAVDEEQRVIAWNRAMEEITGVRKEDVLGHGDHAYALALHGELRPTLLDALDFDDPDVISRYENFHRKGSTVNAELLSPSAYGNRGAYLELIASPLLDKAGKRAGAIECIRDITERKRAERDLQTLQEQLRQAVKMEAIGRLAGGVAHDFNNQLTIIQSYSKLVLERLSVEMSDCVREVNEIFRAAERSAQLTRQLLAFGRKQVLHSEVLDLKQVLMQLHDPLARMIGEDVHLEMHVADDLCNVKVDRNQLEQAIINLAVNARDAMPGGGNLTIEARNVVLDSDYVLRHMGAREGEHVCVRATDSGTGMDESVRARMFEPFFTTKPVGVGTGLGLSLVYGFVKQSGGYIDVASEVGRGSCFQLYFPTAVEAIASTEISTAEECSAAGTETILVIEDQEALRVLTSHILESAGYHVLQADGGHSAIELSQKYDGEIDLVLSDVMMPGLSGPEVVRRIARHRPGLKIVFVTGNAEESICSGELQARILRKPFTPEILFRVVRQVLDLDANARAA